MATQTAVLAAPFIWASGQEVVPIGGFTGTIPEPTLATLKNLIATDVATFLQSPTTTDPRLVWVARNCLKVTKRSGPAPGAADRCLLLRPVRLPQIPRLTKRGVVG